eukprot:TRINITY_DN889_c0_g1_i1.p1 TRINITY_DN889_c0_g1~~TRINITY_DN889_c0_g1_i1.p1  ORF type:complete len:121 (-),score=26.32 TRINITY_DN889_c0_g1_i1:38-400(-)
MKTKHKEMKYIPSYLFKYNQEQRGVPHQFMDPNLFMKPDQMGNMHMMHFPMMGEGGHPMPVLIPPGMDPEMIMQNGGEFPMIGLHGLPPGTEGMQHIMMAEVAQQQNYQNESDNSNSDSS